MVRIGLAETPMRQWDDESKSLKGVYAGVYYNF